MNPIVLGLICFVAGLIVGTVALLFVMGTSKTNREHEIYMEGYNAGFIKGRYDENIYDYVDDGICDLKYRMRKECVEDVSS